MKETTQENAEREAGFKWKPWMMMGTPWVVGAVALLVYLSRTHSAAAAGELSGKIAERMDKYEAGLRKLSTELDEFKAEMAKKGEQERERVKKLLQEEAATTIKTRQAFEEELLGHVNQKVSEFENGAKALKNKSDEHDKKIQVIEDGKASKADLEKKADAVSLRTLEKELKDLKETKDELQKRVETLENSIRIRDPFKVEQAKQQMRKIRSVLGQYKFEQEKIPEEKRDGDWSPYPLSSKGGLALLTNKVKDKTPLMAEIPVDPWGHKYFYQHSLKSAGSGQHLYTLKSMGPDQTESTAVDIE